ncbi:Trypsin 3A1, partial [Dufourea novaeangliae]
VENVMTSTKTRIIGGHPVDIKRRPFMLSLYDSGEFICGASILSEKWGITALHCLSPERTTDYYVRAGSNAPYRGSRHRLTKIHAYNATTFLYWWSSMYYHDIAIFEVRPPFRFSKSVQAVRLPSEFSRPPPKLYVCGWGYTDFQQNNKISDTLMGVHVRRVPHEICIHETTEYEFLVNKQQHLCYGNRGKDSCSGDSGGPLASRNTIYGIVSFGQNCGTVSGVYESVSYYRRWIRHVTNL